MRRKLRCRVSHTPAGDRIEVSGKLTTRTQRRVTKEMWRRAFAKDGPVTVDLTNVTYFDGTSVLILLGTKRIVESQLGCVVDLTGLETATERILAVAA